MTRWADKYMAVPFRDAGRTMRGADCFGLYALILALEAGVCIGKCDVSYGTDPEAVVRHVADEIASGRWLTVAVGDGAVAKPVARLFDAVVMSGHIRTGNRVVRGDVHIGCALGDGRVLHTEPVTGPQIMALDDPRIIKRVKGVYRPQVLEERAAA